MTNFVRKLQAKYIFFGSLSLSIFLQFWHITTYSFWFDESYTASLIATDPSKIIHLTSLDVHPPLYYLTLYGWSKLFGNSDFALRLMSAVFTILAIILLVVLLKRLVKSNYAYLAASLASLAPFTIRYAQEARMYAMVSLLLITATLVLVIQMQRKQRSFWLWVAYSLLISLALYTHYFSGLLMLVHIIYVYYCSEDTTGLDKRTAILRRLKSFDRGFLFSLPVIVLLYSPWIPTLFHQFRSVNSGFWIPDADAVSLGSAFSMLTAFVEINHVNLPLVATYLLIVFDLTLAIFVIKRLKRLRRISLFLLLGGLLVPLVSLFVMSILPFMASFFYFRYFAEFSLFYYAGWALVMVWANLKIGGKLVNLLIILNLLVFSLGTVRVLKGVDKVDYGINQTFPKLEARFQEGDEIIASGIYEWFNARHYNHTSTSVKYPDTGYLWGSHAPIYESYKNVLVDKNFDDVNPTSGRVWVIASKDFGDEIPANWRLISDDLQGKDSNILLYVVD